MGRQRGEGGAQEQDDADPEQQQAGTSRLAGETVLDGGTGGDEADQLADRGGDEEVPEAVGGQPDGAVDQGRDEALPGGGGGNRCDGRRLGSGGQFGSDRGHGVQQPIGQRTLEDDHLVGGSGHVTSLPLNAPQQGPPAHDAGGRAFAVAYEDRQIALGRQVDQCVEEGGGLADRPVLLDGGRSLQGAHRLHDIGGREDGEREIPWTKAFT